MLGKLMKYEIKATARTLVPLYAALILLSFVNQLFLSWGWDGSSNSLTNLTVGFSILLYVAIFVAVFVFTYIILIQRFYKNLLGDQGYLMNTLPVETWKLIISKLAVSTMWMIISTCVAVFSIFLLVMPFMDSKELVQVFSLMGQLFSAFTREFGLGGYLAVGEGLLALIVSVASTGLMIYAAIAIRHLFDKHRVLASFAAFLAMNMAIGMITSLLAMGAAAANWSWLTALNHMPSMGFWHGTMWVSIVSDVIFGGVFFFITNYLMTRKLNLE